MNERKRRIGENEAIFRSVNEQVRELTATLSTTTGTIKVVCECGARSCTDQFEITTAAYAEIRADSTLFVVKPGHDLPETETVIDKNDVYWTVRRIRESPLRSPGRRIRTLKCATSSRDGSVTGRVSRRRGSSGCSPQASPSRF